MVFDPKRPGTGNMPRTVPFSRPGRGFPVGQNKYRESLLNIEGRKVSLLPRLPKSATYLRTWPGGQKHPGWLVVGAVSGEPVSAVFPC